MVTNVISTESSMVTYVISTDSSFVTYVISTEFSLVTYVISTELSLVTYVISTESSLVTYVISTESSLVTYVISTESLLVTYLISNVLSPESSLVTYFTPFKKRCSIDRKRPQKRIEEMIDLVMKIMDSLYGSICVPIYRMCELDFVTVSHWSRYRWYQAYLKGIYLSKALTYMIFFVYKQKCFFFIKERDTFVHIVV